MKNLITICIAVLASAGLAFWLGTQVQAPAPQSDSTAGESGGAEPLYWVAPMDANYRRDKPGKSPMGMDLVPVYAEDKTADDPAGTVQVSSAMRQNLGVTTTTAEVQTLERQIHTVGTIQFNEDSFSHFHTRVEGWVESLAVNAVGDRVEQGQLLFTLYSPELVNAQEEFLLAVRSGSEARGRVIEGSERKLRSLGITQKQINQLKNTGDVFELLPFYAQHTGYVAELPIREGMFIRPDTLTMATGSLDKVWVIAEVFENQAGWVETGQPVTMTTRSYPGQQWQGQVDYVYPVLEPDTRTLRVRVVFDNPDEKLKPNMFASLTIDAGTTSGLVVPSQSVIRLAEQTRVVQALGEGRFVSTRITTGATMDDYTFVTEGLQPGDKVVTRAQFLLDSESNRQAEFDRMSNGNTGAAMDHSEMDHSQMDQPRMDHSEMDHSEMDHGDMDHSQMDHADMDQPDMNHSQMNHSEMDHSGKNHEAMDHGDMDHSGMDHSDMGHEDMDHSQMDHSTMPAEHQEAGQ